VTVVEVVTKVKAPAARCFDLSRDIDFHLKSLKHIGERAALRGVASMWGIRRAN
jgi:hypothetical protein